jgi:hypothetical protein
MVMKDLIVRLASMKLAELKFTVHVEDRELGDSEFEKHSLMKLNKILRNLSKRDTRKLVKVGEKRWGDEVVYEVRIQDSFEDVHDHPSWDDLLVYKIIKPENMPSKTFKKLMESL